MSVTLNEAGLQTLLRSEGGPVALDMERRAIKVQAKARANASGEMMFRRTGLLADSVRVVPAHLDGEVGRSIETPRIEGFYMERGTGAHPIHVRNAKFLRSYPDNPTPLRLPYLVQVNHPGTRPRPWLTEALRQAVL